MPSKAKPDTLPEKPSREDLEQAGRIRAYLPTLRAHEEALVREIEETRNLIRDELRAYRDLMGEPDSTPERAA
jgi:hypothetical protein